jgi:hypothetical protein
MAPPVSVNVTTNADGSVSIFVTASGTGATKAAAIADLRAKLQALNTSAQNGDF